MSTWPPAPPEGGAPQYPGYAPPPPQPGYAPPPAFDGSAPQYGVPPYGGVGGPVYAASGTGGSNASAVISLIAGILGLFVFPPLSAVGVLFDGGIVIGLVGLGVSVLAIVTGVLGMKTSNTTGSGKGLALAGLILGVIGLLSGIITTFVVSEANQALDEASEAFGVTDELLDDSSAEVNEAFSELDQLLEDLGEN